jgi:hypothetical protein
VGWESQTCGAYRDGFQENILQTMPFLTWFEDLVARFFTFFVLFFEFGPRSFFH